MQANSRSTGTATPDDRRESEDDRRNRRRAVVASAIGAIIEWYDFGLYSIAAGLVFPALFFPSSDHVVGIINSFLVFAVGYVARPVGALIFGHYGDRLGRKGALIATILLMGIGTFVVALVPTYEHIGIWGAVILSVLRFLQGMGVGGEWSGAILVSMEWSRNGRRGLFASWPQVGVPLGSLLANLAFGAASFTTGSAFMTWGWRVPFAISALLVVLGLYMRLGLDETPVFRKAEAEGEVRPLPVLDAIRRHYKEIILISLLRMSELSSFIVFTVFVFTIGVQMLHFNRNFILSALLVALAIECVFVPMAGGLSDRYGRKVIFMIGVAAAGLYSFVYFAGFATGSAPVVFLLIALSLIPHGLQYGSEAALITENFSANVRYSGSAIGYQLASIFGGGPTPLIATALLVRDPSGYLVAGYLLLCSIISIVATAFMKDGRHLDMSGQPAEPQMESQMESQMGGKIGPLGQTSLSPR
ncbi:MAG TPA: MFS transporter [Rhodopila sp.]|uniref:MFS transporter n=1 Tax=Rhodopila sp. TaxID=2480087 RepID=UPI002CDC8D22|nr:MFS transporter [Rhodopila sp.]HVY15661.1 MFS transporter [Rhodopila sp.]